MPKTNAANSRLMALITGVFSLTLLFDSNEALAWEACPPHVQVQSSNSNRPTSITFTVNRSAPFPVDIMWIDQTGRMNKYNRLAPGQSYTQQTYVGHYWAAHDGGSCEYFEATNSPMRAYIQVDNYQNVPINSNNFGNRPLQRQTRNNRFTADEKFFGTKIYGYTRGWRIVEGNQGCSAYIPNSGPSIVFSAPLAGGWQIAYRHLNRQGDIRGIVDVDKASFPQTFYTDDGWAFGEFPLNLRLAVKAGRTIYSEIGNSQYRESLTGSTAALLKVQECWQRMTGWTPASNKAGTFAFSGN